MKIGYARVSTEEQNLDLQRQALTAAGCEAIYEDRGVSGAAVNHPGLDQALQAVQAGDVLTIWKLDRLGRRWRISSMSLTASARPGPGSCPCPRASTPPRRAGGSTST